MIPFNPHPHWSVLHSCWSSGLKIQKLLLSVSDPIKSRKIMLSFSGLLLIEINAFLLLMVLWGGSCTILGESRPSKDLGAAGLQESRGIKESFERGFFVFQNERREERTHRSVQWSLAPSYAVMMMMTMNSSPECEFLFPLSCFQRRFSTSLTNVHNMSSLQMSSL